MGKWELWGIVSSLVERRWLFAGHYLPLRRVMSGVGEGDGVILSCVSGLGSDTCMSCGSSPEPQLDPGFVIASRSRQHNYADNPRPRRKINSTLNILTSG